MSRSYKKDYYGAYHKFSLKRYKQAENRKIRHKNKLFIAGNMNLELSPDGNWEYSIEKFSKADFYTKKDFYATVDKSDIFECHHWIEGNGNITMSKEDYLKKEGIDKDEFMRRVKSREREGVSRYSYGYWYEDENYNHMTGNYWHWHWSKDNARWMYKYRDEKLYYYRWKMK